MSDTTIFPADFLKKYGLCVEWIDANSVMFAPHYLLVLEGDESRRVRIFPPLEHRKSWGIYRFSRKEPKNTDQPNTVVDHVVYPKDFPNLFETLLDQALCFMTLGPYKF